MTAIRVAVIGAGHQGRRHAEKLSVLDASHLFAVADLDRPRADAAASKFGSAAVTDFHDLLGEVEAAVVATPTSTHFGIAGTLLENGVHVLVEKPLAASVDEARQLVELAEGRGLVLQVGHLERFNPAVVALSGMITRPQFIESNRIAPYKPLSLDISVVLDLMIHDIDLIHSFVRSPMRTVDAVGRSVFSTSTDVANARINFANGCVANVTSSRVSLKTERSLRIFQADSYLSADLHRWALTRISRRGDGPVNGPEDVMIDRKAFESADAMMDQARAFLSSVTNGSAPLVDGRTAMEALETAAVIAEVLTRQGPA